MKVVLGLVGGLLAFDCLASGAILLAWAVRGHTPNFLTLSLFGVWSVAAIGLKTIGGVVGAIQLWRFKPSGRVIAAVVLANDVLYTVGAATQAGQLMDPKVLLTVGLFAVPLVLVLLPAAAEACQPVARGRPPVRRHPAPNRPARR